MTNNNPLNNGLNNNQFHLCQIVALSLTYRRILKACLGLPSLTILSPLAFQFVCFLSDHLTMNHSLLSILLTYFGTSYIREMIGKSAPSKKQADESLAKTNLSLPCFIFAATLILIRFVVTPIEKSLGLANILTWTPKVATGFAFRLAIGMLILGFAVILRFVGPASIVRCSSSPLLEHSLTTWVNSVMSHVHSAGALAEFIATPSDPSKETIAKQQIYTESARRLQFPDFRNLFKQILLSVIVGIMVAHTSVLPFSPMGINAESPQKAALVVSCIFAIIVNLWPLLTGSSHEINPHRYHASQSLNRSSFGRMFSSIPSLFVSSCAVPFIAIISLSVVGNDDENGSSDTTLSLIAASFFIGLVINAYLHIFAEALRVLLCSPPLYMKQYVADGSNDDTMSSFLEVTMYSLLHSDMSLVEKLCFIGKSRVLSLDQEELTLNEQSIKGMANVLLQKTVADEVGSHLEEDILRLSILASLGGLGSASTDGLDKADVHHVENIKQWVQPRDKLQIENSRSELLAVPLVRALCAYAGGLGEALLTVCTSYQNKLSSSFPWLLPPGAIVCAEYAIRAAARCIFWNLSNSTKCLSDWRSSHLSMLVPVLMNSACRLESGMIKYAEARRGAKYADVRWVEPAHLGVQSKQYPFSWDHSSLALVKEPQLTPEQKVQLLKTESPELLTLYHACNDSASMILKQLRALEGPRNFDLGLKGAARRWTDNLLARIPSPATAAVPNSSVVGTLTNY